MKIDLFNLKDRYIIITGAAGLLGYHHSLALLEINCNLILTDINLKQLSKQKNKLKKLFPKNKISAYKMDVTNENSILEVLNKIQNNKVKLYGLINNAAIDSKLDSVGKFTSNNKFENFDLKRWNKELNVGLTGAMLCSKNFGKIKKKNRNGGVILNVASDLSVISPNQSLYGKKNFKPITYSVIKHGLIGLTKYLATYWSKNNIRCNAISPGSVYDKQSKIFVNKLNKLIPLNRMAKKNEYKTAIQFIFSDGSSYMTGQNLVIDGGRSIW